MNLKSKLVGVVAAGALSIGIVSGAMAEGNTAPVSANFTGPDCGITATDGTDLAFGPFVWNGVDAYEYSAGADSDNVQFSVTTPGPSMECVVNFTLGGDALTDADTSQTIAASNLSFKTNNTPGSAQSLGNPGATFSLGSDTTYAHSVLTLPSDVQPGSYTGTLVMQIVTAAP